KVVVKDADGNDIVITNYVFFEDGDNIILDLVFTKTGKPTIVRFADVSVAVPHSGTQEDILQALPPEVFAYLSDGRMVSVPVIWNNVDDLDPETLEVQNVTAHGNYAGEDYVLADGVSLTADATVLAVERTVSPAALPGNGEYTGVQRIYLEAEDGATIYYALTEPNEQGQDPDSAALEYTEYTEPIILNEFEKTIIIYAYAKKDGLRDSTVAIFRYEIKKLDIKYEAKSATCTEDGNIEYWQCSESGKYFSDENGETEIRLKDTVIPAIGHDYQFVEFVWTEFAAQAKYVCSHDENHIALYDATVTNEVTKAATCTETGVRTYTATYGDYSDTKSETLALIAHDFGDWITTKEPTCIEKGSKHKVCTVCNEELEKADIDALGHDYQAFVTAPTCTEQGYTAHICSRCDDSYVDTYVDALGHDWSECTVTKAAQIGVKGEETRTCSVCGEIETREIAARPYVPTTNEDGEKIYSETVTEEPKDVTELFAQAKEEEGSVEIKATTDDNKEFAIVFDSNAVKAIGNANVSLSAKVVTENVQVENAELVLEVKLDGATFEGGEATVSIPFEKEVPTGKVAKVYYIADDGTRTDMNATLVDGKIVFTTNHFSTYAVLFEDAAVVAPDKNELSGGAIAGIVIGSVFGALLIACAVLFLLNKKGVIKLGKKD
ncbi:MAG: chitobiase/beta-hexosaminidase C-terminal domain-containing protein, partial [Clostridia bacterium]|nr:chitobiase/beta-hexosaminidase C-terminal domain-containing protein [Clostridia bacterium]